MESLIGQRIDKYELIALLGRGGMAEVYRARQMLGGRVAREVALKLIDPRLALTPEFIARFERETQTLASLSHPHILKAYDFGQFGNNVYLVMELLPGGNLAEAIRQGPLPLDVIAGLLDQIGGALDYAHSKGVVHRDLKPHNVLLDESGNAFLTDFGIAKLISETAVLTHSGAVIGTPSYMAPEQWIGGPIDARTDTYAFGVMLFEMLTGRVPFQGDTPYRVMHMHTDEPPPLAVPLRPDLPPTIDQVVYKALAKDPADRYQSATALVKDFKAALMGGAVSAPPLSPRSSAIAPLNAQQLHDPTSLPIVPTPAPVQLRNSPGIGRLVAALAVLVLVIGGIGLGLALGGQSKPPATPTINPTVPAAILPTQALVVMLPTSTSIPPTATLSPTYTSFPTITPLPPTLTSTATAVPPTPTNVPLPAAKATNTHTAAFTPVPPTATDTFTPIPATATYPPTPSRTPLPTRTPIPPTSTLTTTLTPSNTRTATYTPIPPTNTPTMTPSLTSTNTPVQATGTPVPMATVIPTATPIASDLGTVPITTANAAQVRQLAQLGNGTIGNSIAWSPDGKTFAVAGSLGIWLYQANTPDAAPYLLEGHRGIVNSVAFSPDGKTLASGSRYQTIR
ncbi:MAG: WD40 repeat domain-containing serine/threonine protein kinase, partial [Aggregatilineales bacterium]